MVFLFIVCKETSELLVYELCPVVDYHGHRYFEMSNNTSLAWHALITYDIMI